MRLVLCPVALKQREGGKRQGDDQPSGKRSRPDPLAPRRGATTGEDVFGVKDRWLGVLALVDLAEPPLRLAEVPAPEDEAPVAVVLVPLERPDLKAGVVTHPVGIGVKGLGKGPDGGFEITLIGEEDPVPGPGGFGHLFGRHLAADNRHDSLVEARGMLDLFPADVETTESGLITKTKASALSIAPRTSRIHSAVGGMSCQSIQQPRPSSSRARCRRRTNSKSRRE